MKNLAHSLTKWLYIGDGIIYNHYLDKPLKKKISYNESSSLEKCLVMSRKISFGWHYTADIIEKASDKLKTFIWKTNNLKIFNLIYKVFLYFRFSCVNLSKTGKIKKSDEKNLLMFSDNDIEMFEYLYDFLIDKKYINTDDNSINTNMTYRLLFKQDIVQQLEQFLVYDDMLKEIYQLLLDTCFSNFTDADIQKEYFNSFIKRNEDIVSFEKLNEIPRILKILSWLGLLFAEEDNTSNDVHIYKPTEFLEELRGLRLHNKNQKTINNSMIIDNNYYITCNPADMQAQDLYFLNIFCELIRSDTLSIYNFTKKTIQNSIYAGFDIETFVDVLKRNSKHEIDDNILFNIKDWANSIKKIKMKNIQVLKGDKDLIDVLEMSQKSGIQVERIGGEFLSVNSSKQISSFIQSEEVYILKEGVDF